VTVCLFEKGFDATLKKERRLRNSALKRTQIREKETAERREEDFDNADRVLDNRRAKLEVGSDLGADQ